MTLVTQTKKRQDAAAVGDKIREVREAQGLSQDALAARLGTSRNHVSRHENGENEMGIAAYFRYVEALGVDANALAPESARGGVTPLQWHLLALTRDMPEDDLRAVLTVAERLHDHQIHPQTRMKP